MKDSASVKFTDTRLEDQVLHHDLDHEYYLKPPPHGNPHDEDHFDMGKEDMVQDKANAIICNRPTQKNRTSNSKYQRRKRHKETPREEYDEEECKTLPSLRSSKKARKEEEEQRIILRMYGLRAIKQL